MTTHLLGGRTCVTPKKMHIIVQLVSSACLKLTLVSTIFTSADLFHGKLPNPI